MEGKMQVSGWDKATELAESGKFETSSAIMWHIYKSKLPNHKEATGFLNEQMRLDLICYKARSSAPSIR